MSGDWLDILVFEGQAFPEGDSRDTPRDSAAPGTPAGDSPDHAVRESGRDKSRDTEDREASGDSAPRRPAEDTAHALAGDSSEDSEVLPIGDRTQGTGDSAVPAAGESLSPVRERRPRFVVGVSGNTVDLARPADDNQDAGDTGTGRGDSAPATPGGGTPGQGSEDSTRDTEHAQGHGGGQDTGDSGGQDTGDSEPSRTRRIRVTGTGRIPPPGHVVDLTAGGDGNVDTAPEDTRGEQPADDNQEPDGRESRLRRLAGAVRRGVAGLPPGGTKRAAQAGTEWIAEQAPQVPHRLAERAAARWGLLGPTIGWAIYNGTAAGAGHALDWLSGGQYPGLPGAVADVLLSAAADVGYIAAGIIGIFATGLVWLACDIGLRGWCAVKAEYARTSSRPIDRALNFWFIPCWFFRIPLASTAAGATIALGAAVISFTTGAE